MILRHLRAMMDKGHHELDKGSPAAAYLDFRDHGLFPVREIATVGRAPDSHIVVSERSVSRHHARIFFESGHYWLKDLDSANGTKLNGKKVKLQMLSDKDEIAFGETKAVFRTNANPLGPAPLAQDPMEGAEQHSQDGTPTGGLVDIYPYPEQQSKDMGTTLENLNSETIASEFRTFGEGMGGARRMVPDRACPPFQHDEKEAQVTSPEAANLREENARLRRLVAQLERALADSNLRLRNLQKSLDRTK